MSTKISTRPKLFSPSVTREERKISISKETKLLDLKDTNFESTASFRYEEPGNGLKSTQEINLDWDKFENHVFFNSAQSKVNISFDRVINDYPFDGTRKQIEAFEDSLTGYEKYILDSFPKNKGYLFFSGTQKNEDPAHSYLPSLGTHVSVKDSAGSSFPEFSNDITGKPSISFESNPITFDMQIFVPKGIRTYNQIICQSLSNNEQHVSLAMSGASSTDSTTSLIFAICSGSAKMFVSASLERGMFSRICATYDRDITNKLQIYVSESLHATSSVAYEFGSLSFGQSRFLIGSGSLFKATFIPEPGLPETYTFNPVQTLSGALDEFRVFHDQRSILEQQESAVMSVYPDREKLRLHFKFNEPGGSYSGKDVLLDSSGFSLHTRISNYVDSLRLTSSAGDPDNPIFSEKLANCPVLFPNFPEISSFNARLLSSASAYDSENPNLVTRLFPVHYLLEGQSAQGFSSQSGEMNNQITGNSIPGSARLGSAQYLTAFLLIWSKYFDELKIFLDHFDKSLTVDYDDALSVARKLLPQVANYNGIFLPTLFPDAAPTQYIDGENIVDEYSRAEKSLQYVQTEIWKRILVNLNEILLSKGTVHSIKSIIRAAGINPDNLMAIREYGGPTKRSLDGLRETKVEVASSIEFSGSLSNISPGTLTPQGFSSKYPHIISPFLSASRIEVGFPAAAGQMVSKDIYYPHGISNDQSDGLLTSGSFTYESIYQFDTKGRKRDFSENQSLVRFHVSSSANGSDRRSKGISYANLVVLSGTYNSLTSSGSTLRLYMRPGMGGASDPLLRLDLNGPNIFDGSLWNVSFGRERSDQQSRSEKFKYVVDPISNVGSSSYFLRCARQSYGEIKEYFTTASFFMESQIPDGNAQQKLDATLNPSGTMLVIGSQSMANFSGMGSSYSVFLNDSDLESRRGAKVGDFDIANTTNFEGQVSQIRFWSRALEHSEWKEHVRNFKSVGVKDPLVNFNFETRATGSFERLRLDASTDQPDTDTDSDGNIYLVDFSQNGNYLTGSGFEKSKQVILPETFYFSHLSPKFDIAQTDNKVRIRSYLDADKLDDTPYASSAPRYEVLRSEEPDDDTRFTIEFSSMKALDEDIMNIFSDLTFFDNALGDVNLLFDDIYPDLEQARKIYFERLTGRQEIQVFFDMYRWFNSALGSLIEQLIPRKTKFLGVNFVIESHVLERNRFRYLYDEIYLLALDRDTDRGNLLLSQIVGNMKKF